jgi:biopolymer transport protein ExbD
MFAGREQRVKFHTSLGSDTPIDWTPVMGFVLMLFAFFAIASHLERIKVDERTRLPLLALARPPIARDTEASVLDIVRTSSDDTNDVVVTLAGREIALTDLESELDRMRRRMERQRDSDDIAVLVRADETVAARVVQQVVQACQTAGFTRFSLKALANE